MRERKYFVWISQIDEGTSSLDDQIKKISGRKSKLNFSEECIEDCFKKTSGPDDLHSSVANQDNQDFTVVILDVILTPSRP